MSTDVPMTIEEMCSVVEQGKAELERLQRLVANLQEREKAASADRKLWFDKCRRAEMALWKLDGLKSEIDLLRMLANDVDCGELCPHGSVEWDTNAHNCSKERHEGRCAGYEASDLRELADALEAWREAQTPRNLGFEDTLVERVSRAIFLAGRPMGDPDALTPAPRGIAGSVPNWKNAEHLARAAIEACLQKAGEP